MKAVVMAGGQGTRLRPLTSNQPKPMVPIVGKPCMEHILELLRAHGVEEVIVTLAFMPQAVRTYFGSGESLGLRINYSVEESPAGTAGSVKLASDELDETFIVISGDAVCDVDLTQLVDFHRARKASVTIGLKHVDNPLEFGIVVVDEDGRVERFLEKPGWGEVFSDTINTGIYVIEPEVLRHVPDDIPFDFSKELFPHLLELGRPLYGLPLEGYWQDVGNLDQYRQANVDALEERVSVSIPGLRIRGNVWIGDGVDLDDLEMASIAGPAFIGNYCKIGRDAQVGPHTVLSSSVTVRDGAVVARSSVDMSSHIASGARVEGAVVGRSCFLQARARVHEGAALGDEVTLGRDSEILPDVRIYPFKEVEAGTQVDRNLVWESRAASARLFVSDGLIGRMNVDLTPDVALRLGTALGTALRRSDQVVIGRAASRSALLIAEAMTAGLSSTGVDIVDLGLSPASLARHGLRTRGYRAGAHVRPHPNDPELIEINLFEAPGVQLGPELQSALVRHFSRQEFRRAGFNEIGRVSKPTRAVEAYVHDLADAVDAERIQARGFRIAVEYSHSVPALVAPHVFGALGVEVVASRAEVTDQIVGEPSLDAEAVNERARLLVGAVGADLGVVFDPAGERITLIDERGRILEHWQALLLLATLTAVRATAGAIVAPSTATAHLESVAGNRPVERVAASLAALTRASTGEGVSGVGDPGQRVAFAASNDGAYVFPRFLPAPAASASVAMLLDLLVATGESVGQLVDELPHTTLWHRQLQCPWNAKGALMRLLAEELRGEAPSLGDGIRVAGEGSWAQVIPDPDEPVVHLHVEAATEQEAAALDERFVAMVEKTLASIAAEQAREAVAGQPALAS